METFSWIPLLFYIFFLFVIAIIFKNGMKEPNFLTVKENSIAIKTFPYLINKEISITEIKGFSESFKTYYRDSYLGNDWQKEIKFPTFIIYLKNNSTYHLTSYNFKDFRKVKGVLKKKLKYLGKEKEEYKFGIIRRKLNSKR